MGTPPSFRSGGRVSSARNNCFNKSNRNSYSNFSPHHQEAEGCLIRSRRNRYQEEKNAAGSTEIYS